MEIDFYYMSGGPFARRCLLALEVKALDYTPHLVDVSKHENRAPEFLALDARGTLPLLKEGPIVARESQAIMFYLDRAHPQHGGSIEVDTLAGEFTEIRVVLPRVAALLAERS
jgi:glutathione S-transferase